MPPRHPTIARALGEVRRSLTVDDEAAEGLSWLRGRRLVVACSGGPDSLALLGLLGLLAPGLGIGLVVAHVDHGLRSTSSAEAEAVVRLAAERGLAARVVRLELAPGAGLPARAREARRAALLGVAAEVDAGHVALGHTATDQAETVLMHMTRGAGLDGLAAMPAIDGPWLRPLLGVSRAEAAALCRRLGFAPVDDPTNHDERHLRVAIREAVLPRLRAQNPRLERAIGALAGQARDAEEALEGWAAREEASRRGAEGWSTEGLAALPRAIRTRVLRRILRAGGATLEAIGAEVVAAVDRAVVARARAAGGTGDALRPRGWDVDPGLRLVLGPWGLRLGPGGARNH